MKTLAAHAIALGRRIAPALTDWALGGETLRVRQFVDGRIVQPAPVDMGDQSMSRGDAPIYLVWEEIDAVPDEGYDRFSEELVRALETIHPVITHATPKRIPGRAGARFVTRQMSMLAAARELAVRARRPRSIVYASRHAVTIPGLLRARLLRLVGRAPVVMMVLVPNHASRAAMWLLRWLPPDRLLLGTLREVVTARRFGVDAELIWSGVDQSRFRPARPGEKRALRKHYRLPAEDRIVLHVGHLRRSRGLEALLPLGSAPGVTVLLVASHRRWPESEQVKVELQQHHVVVLDGYQPRVEELYRLADCYVFPGGGDRAVSLPLSILEAAASGLPVVSVKYEAVPERLGTVRSIELVDNAAQVPGRVLSVLASPPHARGLPPELSWDGVARIVLAAVDRAVRRPPRDRRLGVVGAARRRFDLARLDWSRRQMLRTDLTLNGAARPAVELVKPRPPNASVVGNGDELSDGLAGKR